MAEAGVCVCAWGVGAVCMLASAFGRREWKPEAHTQAGPVQGACVCVQPVCLQRITSPLLMCAGASRTAALLCGCPPIMLLQLHTIDSDNSKTRLMWISLHVSRACAGLQLWRQRLHSRV